MNKRTTFIAVLVLAIISIPLIFYFYKKENTAGLVKATDDISKKIIPDSSSYWAPPGIETVTDSLLKDKIIYGKELVAHTSKYFGPKGTINRITNGLNCQNCHLQAGTAVFANNFGSVASSYPLFRAREGKFETVTERVNDCFERSLNGKAIDTTGKEMDAIVAYLSFVGSNVEKGKKANGSGLKDLAFLDRAANPAKGKLVYVQKCQVCHQSNGEGVFNADTTEYTFPALWGKHSFNDAAGMYRLISFARYIKYNMPFGTTFKNPQLTDEEAWDVSAFVLSQPRPHVYEPKDWPDISMKPIDHPFGPYADNFSQLQHKYGPFKPIAEERKKTSSVIHEPGNKKHT